jgi:hypothetical protein
MKGLTLTQPWATLIALGAKKIETRSWATAAYCGPIAIHAGAGLGPVGGHAGLYSLCCHDPFASTLIAAGYGAHLTPACGLPLGQIVAVATLVDIVSTDVCFGPSLPSRYRYRLDRWELTDQERAFGDYAPGRYAWLLADVCPLPAPVPARGALGLWNVPAVVEAAIREQLNVTH